MIDESEKQKFKTYLAILPTIEDQDTEINLINALKVQKNKFT